MDLMGLMNLLQASEANQTAQLQAQAAQLQAAQAQIVQATPSLQLAQAQAAQAAQLQAAQLAQLAQLAQVAQLAQAVPGVSPLPAVAGIPALQAAQPQLALTAAASSAGPTQDVEQFLLENSLDLRARKALLEQSEEVQQAVMSRGSVADCANPGSALMSRISDAKRRISETRNPAASLWASGTGGVEASDENTAVDVEMFIMDFGIDDKASAELRREPPNIQRLVMAGGSLADAANPSSAVMGRIRDAKRGRGNPRAGISSVSGAAILDADANTPQLAVEVEQFIVASNLDQRAITSLRSEPASVQKAVIERGSLSECANPSSAVMSRIKDARGNFRPRDLPVSRPTIGASPAPNPLAGLLGSSNNQMNALTALLTGSGAGGTSPGLSLAPKSSADDLESFIAENNLDDNAASAMRKEPQHVQIAVMERGTLADAQNPSSAVMSRIRDAKRLGTSVSTVGGNAVIEASLEVESFIIESGLDERAARSFRSEPPDVQKLVIERGSLKDCTNPSSAVMGRIKEARASLMGGGGRTYAEATEDVEHFIKENGLDDSAAQYFRTEAPHVQQAVMSRGSLADAQNPNSAVMGRIRDAKRGPPAGAGSSSGGGVGVGAVANLASLAGAAGVAGGAGANDLVKAMQVQKLIMEYNLSLLGGAVSPVENYILQNRLDDNAANSFRLEGPEIQQAVMERGPLTDCVNPSSALLGRIRDAKRQATGQPLLQLPLLQLPTRQPPRASPY